MLSRWFACFIVLAGSACAAPVPPAATPQTPQTPSVASDRDRPLLTYADTVAAMCGHDPRVGMRLYGCNRPRGPSLVIDGVLLPTDSSVASRHRRDSVTAAQAGREVVELIFAPADDSVAMATYGSRAREGIVILRTRPRR